MCTIKNLREVLLLVSMIFSFLGVYLVGVNKFFIQRMKSYFKHYPGEESKLNMFINMFTVIIMIIDIISLVIISLLTVIVFIKTKSWDQIYSSLKIESNSYLDIIYFALTIFIFAGPLILLLFNLNYYEESKTFFKWKLGITNIKMSSIKFKFICKISGFKYFNNKFNIKTKLLQKKKKQQLKFVKRKNEMHDEKFMNKKHTFFKASAIMYCVYLLIFIAILVGLYCTKEDKFNNDEICVMLISSLSLFMSITMIVFDNSMTFMYGGFMNNYTYVLVSKDDKRRIKCKSYLEYTDYYLVIEDRVEKYIKKSEIICIEKFKE